MDYPCCSKTSQTSPNRGLLFLEPGLEPVGDNTGSAAVGTDSCTQFCSHGTKMLPSMICVGWYTRSGREMELRLGELSNTIFRIGIPMTSINDIIMELISERAVAIPNVSDLWVEQKRTAMISCLENTASLHNIKVMI